MHENYSFKSKNGNFSIHTSNKEIKDLLVACLFVSMAFAVARTTESGLTLGLFFSTKFLVLMIISAVTVGCAFLLHEMAHKVVAQHYRCWAEFRADIIMLTLGLFMSFVGIVFLAPGAVIIFGDITQKQNGKISMAGPLMNIILAIVLLPLLFANFSSGILREIITSGYLINAWLALFNMIPLWNFDGAKIYAWNKKVFFSMIIVSALLIFVFFAG
jgi:Zn-dependent protease